MSLRLVGHIGLLSRVFGLAGMVELQICPTKWARKSPSRWANPTKLVAAAV